MAIKHLAIVSGISGSGKTKALNYLEDLGYFCIDNMPSPLIHKFFELYGASNTKFEKVALGVDVRGKDIFYNLNELFAEIKKNGIPYDLIFLEASTEVIVRRFKETRRKHPISKYSELVDNIEYEREILEPLKRRATKIIDTSYTTNQQLKEVLYESILKAGDKEFNVQLQFISFGFKYGIPPSSDFVFDMRFLPNPFYVDALKHKTGKDAEVVKYVLDNELGRKALNYFEGLLSFVIDKFKKEKRAYVIISFGCTGGKHRSVALAEYFKDYFLEKGFISSAMHRDLGKE